MLEHAEVLDLGAMGVEASAFRFNALFLSGSRYAAVKESAGLVVVDMLEGDSLVRRASPADAAMMHPVRPVAALRAASGNDTTIQVVDMETKQRVATVTLPERVVFWAWLDDSLRLALVTQENVYHWGEGEPEKVFAREGRLREAQVIGYAVDAAGRWAVLSGLYTPDGGETILGALQLYSLQLQKHQQIDGYCASFAKLNLRGAYAGRAQGAACIAFCERKEGMRLHVRDVSGAAEPFRTALEMTQLAPGDFPLCCHHLDRWGIVVVLTKHGQLLGYDPVSGECVHNERVSDDTIFTCEYDSRSQAVLYATKRGKVGRVVAGAAWKRAPTSLTERYGLGSTYASTWERLVASESWEDAAWVASVAKEGSLREAGALAKVPGEKNLLRYLVQLMQVGRLSEPETLRICESLRQSGRADLLAKWVRQDKLCATEAIADALKDWDPKAACALLKRVRGPRAAQKLLSALVGAGQYAEAAAAAARADPSQAAATLRLLCLKSPTDAAALAKAAAAHQPVLPLCQVLAQQGLAREAITLLMETLGDAPEDADAQTRLFEWALEADTELAESLFAGGTYSRYDRQRIGKLCAARGLHKRALQHFSDGADIRSVLREHGASLDPAWLGAQLSKVPPEEALSLLGDMLDAGGADENVARLCAADAERLGAERAAALFGGRDRALFLYLGALGVAPRALQERHILLAARLGEWATCSRLCLEAEVDPTAVFAGLQAEEPLHDDYDPRPLLYIADRFELVAEAAVFLHQRGYADALAQFAGAPARAPAVVAALLDAGAESAVAPLLRGAPDADAAALIEVCEKRHQRALLAEWLARRAAAGARDAATHNALAHIKLDAGDGAERFLVENESYDSLVVGVLCEERDPALALIAYEKCQGSGQEGVSVSDACAAAFLRVALEHGLHDKLAAFLLKRTSRELWDAALAHVDQRAGLLEACATRVGSAAPSADALAPLLAALVELQLGAALVALLDKLLSADGPLAQNRSLQNLLLVTALEARPDLVSGLLARLKSYDHMAVAAKALELGAHQTAFEIYDSQGRSSEAALALFRAGDQAAAMAYARRIGRGEVWLSIATQQLDAGATADAMLCLELAKSAQGHRQVTARALKEGLYAELARYLSFLSSEGLAREQGHLLCCYAALGDGARVRAVIADAKPAELEGVADRLLAEGHEQYAVWVLEAGGSTAQLARAHLRRGDWAAATAAATAAGNAKLWRTLCESALDGEGPEAAAAADAAALALCAQPDLLALAAGWYAQRGLLARLCAVLETASRGPHAGPVVTTELAAAYAAHCPERLDALIRLHGNKLNASRLLKLCTRLRLWPQAAALHALSSADRALALLCEHPPALAKAPLAELLPALGSADVALRLVSVHCALLPERLADLLAALHAARPRSLRLDLARVVAVLREQGALHVARAWLHAAQPADDRAVNEAVNELLLETGAYEELAQSVRKYQNVDAAKLAAKLQGGKDPRLRRLAALLHSRRADFARSIDIALQDGDAAHAVALASQSADQPTVLALLGQLGGDPAAFLTLLCVCHKRVPADQAVEIAAANGLLSLITPFLVQAWHDLDSRVARLEAAMTGSADVQQTKAIAGQRR